MRNSPLSDPKNYFKGECLSHNKKHFIFLFKQNKENIWEKNTITKQIEFQDLDNLIGWIPTIICKSNVFSCNFKIGLLRNLNYIYFCQNKKITRDQLILFLSRRCRMLIDFKITLKGQVFLGGQTHLKKKNWLRLNDFTSSSTIPRLDRCNTKTKNPKEFLM